MESCMHSFYEFLKLLFIIVRASKKALHWENAKAGMAANFSGVILLRLFIVVFNYIMGLSTKEIAVMFIH